MSGYGQAVQAIRPARITGSKKSKKAKMKLSLKQRLRRWLLDDEADYDSVPLAIRETVSLDSEGMRFTVFKASGGFVIETRTYDRRKDENFNKMYVITETQDLGQELGKIITMESLR